MDSFLKKTNPYQLLSSKQHRLNSHRPHSDQTAHSEAFLLTVLVRDNSIPNSDAARVGGANIDN